MKLWYRHRSSPVALLLLVVTLVWSGSAAGASARTSAGAPACVGLLSASSVATILHVSHLTGPSWHLNGQPLAYCTYGAAPDQLTVGVHPHGTLVGYHEQVAITVGTAKLKQRKLPAFGKVATAISDCVPVIGCHPVVVVLTKGYLIYVSDQLNGASMSSLPKVETLVERLIHRL